jgi:hypothetical protein
VGAAERKQDSWRSKRQWIERKPDVVDAQIRVRSTVRLLSPVQGIPAGTLGSVLGRYVGGESSYLVNFADADSPNPRVAEVGADEIARVEFA